jgi:hypothetical protein
VLDHADLGLRLAPGFEGAAPRGEVIQYGPRDCQCQRRTYDRPVACDDPSIGAGQSGMCFRSSGRLTCVNAHTAGAKMRDLQQPTGNHHVEQKMREHRWIGEIGGR